MTNLTTNGARHRAFELLGLSSFALIMAVSACSSSDAEPSYAKGGSAGQGGGAAGSASGSAAKAGTTSSVAGSANSAGSGGSGGSSGSGGTAGASTAGVGGSGGVACGATDECCDDPNKTEPGECGCGVADSDTDEDGELDCDEQCPLDAAKTMPGMCGCGNTENDSDDDGTIDCKPGRFFEAEDGVLSQVDVPVTPIDEGGGGAGGADGAGGAVGDLPTAFTVGDDAKASKLKYLEAPAGFTSDAAPGPARSTYEFDIPADHAYVFWGRFRAPDIDHNRLWVKVDDGVWTKLRVTTGETWFWFTFHKEGEFDMPIQYTLAKGRHTLIIASASDGVRVDRFYVTPSSDKPPGDDTVCNPPHSIQIGDQCKSSCGMLQGNSCDVAMCAGKTLLPAYDCAVCCSTL